MAIAVQYELRKLTLFDGTCPFDWWFESLPVTEQYMVINRLSRVRLGAFGEISCVGGGVWELKFRKGPGFRVYYAQAGKQVLLLISGGDKRTQNKDIEHAKKFYRDFAARELNYGDS
jgi:putative addiction module killer protein